MTFRYRQFKFTHYKNISSVRKIIPLSIKLGLFGHGFATATGNMFSRRSAASRSPASCRRAIAYITDARMTSLEPKAKRCIYCESYDNAARLIRGRAIQHRRRASMILYERDLPDGRQISVLGMIFNFRLCIGDGKTAYDDGYCYPQDLGLPFVLAAAEEWDGTNDPADGWTKHIGSGRKRPGGDPTKEYVDV